MGCGGVLDRSVELSVGADGDLSGDFGLAYSRGDGNGGGLTMQVGLRRTWSLRFMVIAREKPFLSLREADMINVAENIEEMQFSFCH